METIKIYKKNLIATDKDTNERYTITSGGNGYLYITIREDGEEVSLTRQELKKMICDIDAIDETLDFLRYMDAEKIYTDDGLNFITESEYNQLSFLKDDFKKVSFEIVEN